MSSRLPAEDIYKIEGRDLADAIARWRAGEVPSSFADSTKYDLLFQDKRIPPKMIVALAAMRPLGRVLVSSDISGGESSPAFRLLLQEGYEIVTKHSNIVGIDSTFSVGRSKTAEFVIVESKGPERNVDYLPGLERILVGMADVDATLEKVSVESTVTRGMPKGERSVNMDGHYYPVRLRRVSDIGEFRRQLTSSVAQTGRTKHSKGGGYPTKRLRLEFATPGDYTLVALLEYLGGGGASSSRSAGFMFRPGSPTGNQGGSKRSAQGETSVSHVHVEMQNALYIELLNEYCEDNVAAENPMAVGNPADLVVSTPDGYAIYEIKTSLLPRQCIRQAIGQLLEYAYWLRSPEVCDLVVVGPSELDRDSAGYIESLRTKSGCRCDTCGDRRH